MSAQRRKQNQEHVQMYSQTTMHTFTGDLAQHRQKEMTNDNDNDKTKST